ncbi:MAG: methyltransferase domain-containing protein [Actinomycetota bacterium]|nr:MAG: methyltransferase domain-containing protein [Actinomycetota bacterium]
MANRVAIELRDDVYRRPLETATERLEIAAGWKCVDVGAGGGDVSVALGKIVGSTGRVFAVDIDPKRRDQVAEIAARETQVIALTQAAEEMMLPEKVDLAFCRFLLLQVVDPVAVVQRMASVVKGGGWIVIQEAVTSAGRIGESAISALNGTMKHPDIGIIVPRIVRQLRLEITDCWAEAPVGLGDTPESRYLEAMTDILITDEPVMLPPLVTTIARVPKY